MRYLLALGMLIMGCRPVAEEKAFPPFPAVTATTNPQEKLVGTTAQVVRPQPVAVEGYGLVGGLARTGSTDCPPPLRAYLHRFVQSEVPDRTLDIDALIRNPSTAVVRIEGRIPALARRNDVFDLKIKTLTDSDATSLRGGWLYTAQLWPVGSDSQALHIVASAHGPVYVDRLGQTGVDECSGFILGGGTCQRSMVLNVVLNQADYRTSAAVRNVINLRFGAGTAVALDAQHIQLQIPASYLRQRERFLAVVEQIPLNLQPDYLKQRGSYLVQQLPQAQNKLALELALEALGTAGEPYLQSLLQSQDLGVRLLAARSLANLGTAEGLEVLRQIAVNVQSPVPLRVEAIKALGATGNPVLAQQILRPLWRDSSLDVVLTAYEQSLELGPRTVDRVTAGQYIQVDSLDGGPRKAIVAYRSKVCRLALIGGPLSCQSGQNLISPDQTLWLDSRSDPGWVLVGRHRPGRADLGPVRCPNDLKIIIQVLCADSHNTLDQPGGLGLSYADLLDFLKFLCDKGVIQAEFWGGPLPG